MIPVTPELWALWKDHPCTIAFMTEVKKLREEGIQELPALADNPARQNIAIGKVVALTNILEADIDGDTE